MRTKKTAKPKSAARKREREQPAEEWTPETVISLLQGSQHNRPYNNVADAHNAALADERERREGTKIPLGQEMTLRDYFAATWIQGRGGIGGDDAALASRAYELADALLAARVVMQPQTQPAA